jgi:hypothetical protein
VQALLGSMLDAEKAIDRHEMDKRHLQVRVKKGRRRRERKGWRRG